MLHNSYTKEFLTSPEILPIIENYVLEIAQKIKMDKHKINQLGLSVAEAASNAIVHGNKSDPSKKIAITFNIFDNRYEVIVKDEGKGFDIEKIPDPTKPENIFKDSGRGIHIMNNFLNKLDYNFTDTGTEAILTLYKQ